jgi:glycosyltransferase involved in cell wall biosynthesis
MNQLPLISVGVPTYNRAEGLRNTVLGIIRQSYTNIEIIVSDNCSPGETVNKVMSEFCQQDHRITFYKQEKNLGPTDNFYFVLSKAKSNYFIWAADDDEWQGDDFLYNLYVYAPYNVLTFPDAILINAQKEFEFPLKIYENCKTKIDYSKAFCSAGEGYPFYGLYNLELFRHYNQQFKFDLDLIYYGEGTFLHRLFLSAPAKYVQDAKIKFSTNSIKPLSEKLLDAFLEYFKRTLLIYIFSDLSSETKSELIQTVFDNYTKQIKKLALQQIDERGFNGKSRIKKAVRILIKGTV